METNETVRYIVSWSELNTKPAVDGKLPEIAIYREAYMLTLRSAELLTKTLETNARTLPHTIKLVKETTNVEIVELPIDHL